MKKLYHYIFKVLFYKACLLIVLQVKSVGYIKNGIFIFNGINNMINMQ